MSEKKGKLSELIPDDKNLNKHTQYGMSLLEKSVRGHKFGRSILVDKNNRIIAGNGIVETAANIGAEDIRIIETTGDELVVVKRTDVDLDTKEGREMALADNATSAADLEWDMENLQMIEEDFDVEVSDWGVEIDESKLYGDEFSLPDGDKSQYGQMTFIVTDEQRDIINKATGIAIYCDDFDEASTDNKNQNGAALYLIVKEWLDNQKSEKSVEELGKSVEELRQYLRDSLKKSGKKSSDVDLLLGTQMSGHYFGESQWMFPTIQAYLAMRQIMDLPRDYFECKKIEKAYNKALKLSELSNGKV